MSIETKSRIIFQLRFYFFANINKNCGIIRINISVL